jgi:hypothetical protein
METDICRVTGINIEHGSAPKPTGVRVPYVLLRMQGRVAAETITLIPLWMSADHARALAAQLLLAADQAGKPPADTPVH